MDDSTEVWYGITIGRYILMAIGKYLRLLDNTIGYGKGPHQVCTVPMVDLHNN